MKRNSFKTLVVMLSLVGAFVNSFFLWVGLSFFVDGYVSLTVAVMVELLMGYFVYYGLFSFGALFYMQWLMRQTVDDIFEKGSEDEPWNEEDVTDFLKDIESSIEEQAKEAEWREVNNGDN